jgi:hypothetical protein
MAPSNLHFPSALPADPKSVSSALEAGHKEWTRGDLREAVRWVHRAADAAEAAGDDRRALDLARIAADLMSSLELSASVPKSVPRDEASALTPFDDFNDQTIVDSPAILAARAAQQGTVVIEERRTPATESGPIRVPVAKGTPRARTALRVAVARADDVERVLIVRVLEEGAAPPIGAAEALLLWLDPDAALPTEIRRA